MSELKAYRPRELVMQGRHNEPIYLKSEADKVIADLEEFAEDACLERDDNQNVIDELEAENRKLKRALWLARAERAKECHFMWCQLIYDKKYGIVKFNVRKKWWEEDVKQGQTLHTPQGWADVWDEIEYRCSKKAEEYK